MSPRLVEHGPEVSGFPRVSGDEPWTLSFRRASDAGFPRVSGDEPPRFGQTVIADMFSPRERG